MSKLASKVQSNGSLKSQQDNLIYVRDMLGELRKVAESEGADMLCYFIEMAYIETGDILSDHRPIKSGLENKGYETS